MKTPMPASFLLALLIACPVAANPPAGQTASAADTSERPLAPSPFNEKALLVALSKAEGRVEHYKVAIHKGWLDKNRLSVTIKAEVVDSRGERKTISRNAVVTFQDGRQSSIALE